MSNRFSDSWHKDHGNYQPLSWFHLPYILIARCGSLIYSEFKHTYYYTLDHIRVKDWSSTSLSQMLQTLNLSGASRVILII